MIFYECWENLDVIVLLHRIEMYEKILLSAISPLCPGEHNLSCLRLPRVVDDMSLEVFKPRLDMGCSNLL